MTNITKSERHILRELAKRQCEISSLPIMAERKKHWRDLNDGKTTHPMVTMEFHGLANDVYPALTCENDEARALESQMLLQLFKYETYKDDRVIPDSVSVAVPNWIRPFSFDAKEYKPASAKGADTMGYMYTHAVHDLEKDFHVFKSSPFFVDAGLVEAYKKKAQVEDIIGDIIPIRLSFPAFWFSSANALIQMMSMETLYLSLYDYPDLFHLLMRRLTDDYHSFIDALEANNGIIPNNDDTCVPMDSFGYTNDLPGVGELQRPVKLSDVWGYTNFQETVGMSISMFDEFFFSYMKEIADRCGLFAYGCCEPVHTLWEPCLSRLKTLRKLSVSPWCDEEFIGDAIRGKKIVYHRKPFPNFISVDAVFDDEAFLMHMKKTVKAAQGCPLEITFRDITSVRGEPWRLTRAVELTKEAFARWWKN